MSVVLMPGIVQVISVLQEAAGLPGAPLDGHKPPGTDIQHESLSGTDPRQSSDSGPHSMCQTDTSSGSPAPPLLGERSSASQSSDSPTAGVQHSGMQQAEHMQAGQAAEVCPDSRREAKAKERGLPVSCGHAAGSMQVVGWPGTGSGEDAAVWKMGEAGSGAYAPALVLEGAAVLTTALSLLTALCR